MLAHFENFDFFSLLKNFDRLHIRLVDCLYGELVSVLFVLSKLYDAKLPFAKIGLQLVKVIDVKFTNYLANRLDPLCLTFNRAEVKDSGLVWGQNNLDWVQELICVRVHLRLSLLNESSSETVHDTLVVVTLLSVAHEILAEDLCPVLFESVSASFKETFTL